MNIKDVFIIEAKRTPVGSFLGSLSSIPATDLGSIAIKSVLKSTNINQNLIDECIMGNVLTSGLGQAPARQAAIKAGLPDTTACFTINKVCGSGLQSIILGANSIALKNSEFVISGGQESMSQAPYLLPNIRNEKKMGNKNLIDAIIHDGLWDVYNQKHMGELAELCAEKYNISRIKQDEFSINSYQKALEAQKNNLFAKELTFVEYIQKNKAIQIKEDDEPKKADFDKLKKLKPVFKNDGTITAANASKVNDGAAAVLLTNEDQIKKYNLIPKAQIIAHACTSDDPKWFTLAPIKAIKKVLHLANLKVSDIDLWEINEAFSVVTIAAMKELDIPDHKVNVNGGAVALGHPIGASGTRIFTTLLHALNLRQKKLGLATACIGGGESCAIIIKNSCI